MNVPAGRSTAGRLDPPAEHPQARYVEFSDGFRMSVPESLPRSEDQPTRKITMVKKLLQNGEPCAKCAQAEDMLRGRGVWDQIDEVVWAKEGDAESPGAQLGRKYGVDLAPFFVIERPGKNAEVFQSTLKLIKELAVPAPGRRCAGAGCCRAGASARARRGRRARPRASGQVPAGDPRMGPVSARERCAIAFSGAEDVVLVDMASKRDKHVKRVQPRHRPPAPGDLPLHRSGARALQHRDRTGVPELRRSSSRS